MKMNKCLDSSFVSAWDRIEASSSDHWALSEMRLRGEFSSAAGGEFGEFMAGLLSGTFWSALWRLRDLMRSFDASCKSGRIHAEFCAP
jgi:hypothetical protein